LSPYLFSVYLDGLSLELSNIKAWCYIGEVLLKHLMFADDICVFCSSVRGLQGILDVGQDYLESHEIICNCSRTDCMMFKAETARSTVIPLLALGVQRVKYVSRYKYMGIVLDIELSDDKDIQRQLGYQYYAVNKLRASFSQCSNSVTNVLFRSFFTPMCASQSHGVISGRHTSTDGVWLVTLVAGLCRTCRGERVLVVIRFNVTLLPLRPYSEKCVPVSWKMQKVQQRMVTRFDAVRLFIPVLSLFFEHYNRIWLCDRVPRRYSVSLTTCAGHNAFVLTRVGLYF